MLTPENLIKTSACIWLGGCSSNQRNNLEKRPQLSARREKSSHPWAVSDQSAFRTLCWVGRQSWAFLSSAEQQFKHRLPSLQSVVLQKQGLISPSPAHSGDLRRGRDNCVHYLQPQLAVQRGILLQLIISRVPASSVSIRRHSAFLPRGRENEQLRSLSQVLPLTPASLPRDHSELHWAEAHLPHLTGGCPSEAALWHSEAAVSSLLACISVYNFSFLPWRNGSVSSPHITLVI